MTTYVCFWPPSISKGNISHISLWVDGGSPKGTYYLSRWPGSVWAGVSVGSGANFTYAQDIEAEGGEPHKVVLSRLDETAIKSAISTAKNINVYGIALANCATWVSACLRAGVDTTVLDVLTALALMPFLPAAAIAEHLKRSTPPSVYAYAQSLRADYA